MRKGKVRQAKKKKVSQARKARGGCIKARGVGAATKGINARGPMG